MIPNYDQEIERRYHPENFKDEIDTPEPPAKVRNWFNKGLKKAKRGSARESKIIQNKKRATKNE